MYSLPLAPNSVHYLTPRTWTARRIEVRVYIVSAPPSASDSWVEKILGDTRGGETARRAQRGPIATERAGLEQRGRKSRCVSCEDYVSRSNPRNRQTASPKAPPPVDGAGKDGSALKEVCVALARGISPSSGCRARVRIVSLALMF